MSCYFIARIRIHNWEEYARYEAAFDEVLAPYQGEVVGVDSHPIILEGICRDTRIVIIRFPDETEARRWYDSDAYQTLARHRFRASESNVVLVHGRA